MGKTGKRRRRLSDGYSFTSFRAQATIRGRFAFYVGRRCRQASVRDVAAELKLTWDTVKALEMLYMRAQIERAATPGPRTIGIDEIAVRKGHDYRIVVSDLRSGLAETTAPRPAWRGSMPGWDRKRPARSSSS
jgi:hypothetical protein